jgi:hypothetical protein
MRQEDDEEVKERVQIHGRLQKGGEADATQGCSHKIVSKLLNNLICSLPPLC